MQDMGSYGDYGYGMASDGYGMASYGYGEPGYGGASISGTYGMVCFSYQFQPVQTACCPSIDIESG